MAACRQALEAHILALRRTPQAHLSDVPLTPEQRENLRALGYVQAAASPGPSPTPRP
jgi:hypothetical protein